MKTQLPRLPATLLILLFACTGWGATRTYFDRSEFTNASRVLPGIRQTIDFDSFLTPSTRELEFGPSLSLSGVTFSGRHLHVSSLPPLTSSGVVLFNSDSDIPLTISFDYGARAFGANWGSGAGAQFPSFTATLTLESGESFSFESPTNPESTFFGFIVDQPIMSLTFSDGAQFVSGGFHFHGEMLKDICMVAVVPEPGTVSLFAIGWAVLFVRRRLRMR